MKARQTLPQKTLRLLFLTMELPYPPIGGAAVRVWSLLRALAAEHQVELLCFGDPEKGVPEPLAEICSRVTVLPSPLQSVRWRRLAAYLKGAASPVPWMVQEWRSEAMERAVEDRSREADAVVAVLLAMGQYLHQVDKPMRVYDAHNVEHQLLELVGQVSRAPLRRLHALRESRRVRAYEREMCLETDLIVSVTAQDALGLLRLCSDAFVRTVPISLVLGDYRRLWKLGEPKLIFFGDMAWLPNVDAARWLCTEILPRLEGMEVDGKRLSRPQVVLAGRRPAKEVRALEGKGVQVTGFVPSMEEVLEGDTIVAVPLRAGGGMRVKILEALAWGLPVVSTTLGCQGIDHGGVIYEANGAKVFAEALGRLLADPMLRRAMSLAGRRRVGELYGHERVGRRLVDALREVPPP